MGGRLSYMQFWLGNCNKLRNKISMQYNNKLLGENKSSHTAVCRVRESLHFRKETFREKIFFCVSWKGHKNLRIQILVKTFFPLAVWSWELFRWAVIGVDAGQVFFVWLWSYGIIMLLNLTRVICFWSYEAIFIKLLLNFETQI